MEAIIKSLADAAHEAACEIYQEGVKSGTPEVHNPAMVQDLAGHAVSEALKTLVNHANSDAHTCCDGVTCSLIAIRTLELLLSTLTDALASTIPPEVREEVARRRAEAG